MSASTTVIAGCTVVTFAIKAAGPVLLGGRELPAWSQRVLRMLAPALLAALVVVSALAEGKHLSVGANTAGVACASAVFWRTSSIIACVVVAALVTAGLRAI